MSRLSKNSKCEEVNEFIDFINIEKGLSVNTQNWYKRDIELMLEFIKKNPTSIEEDDIFSYIETLRKKFTAYTVLRKISSIKNFYRFLKSEKKITVDPCRNLENIKKNIKVPEVLKLNEVKALIDVIGNNPLEQRDRMILKLLYSTGARISEIINLKIDDIDTDFKFIRLLGKGNKIRLVPIYKEIGEELEFFIKNIRRIFIKEGNTETYLFPDISRQNYWRRLKIYAKKAGIKKNIYPHILRHSVATILLENRADIRIVQEIMGHSSIATTELYTHVDKSVIRNIYDTIKIGDN